MATYPKPVRHLCTTKTEKIKWNRSREPNQTENQKKWIIYKIIHYQSLYTLHIIYIQDLDKHVRLLYGNKLKFQYHISDKTLY